MKGRCSMERLYSLACEYLGTLQVTRGLTEADLTAPNLFAACGVHTGPTTNPFRSQKFTSGRFVDTNGDDLSKDPRQWPGGRAVETNLGPWRYSEDALRLALEMDMPDYSREMLADLLCSEHLDGSDLYSDDGSDLHIDFVPKEEARALEDLKARMDGPRPHKDSEAWIDWGRTFDLTGPNADVLEYLDRAEWQVWTGPQSGPYRPPSEGDHAAFWRFSDGSSVRLSWDPDNLITGASVLRQVPGKLDTGLHFQTIPDFLVYLSLLPCGPADPFAAVQNEAGDVDSSLEFALRRTVCDTRIVTRL